MSTVISYHKKQDVYYVLKHPVLCWPKLTRAEIELWPSRLGLTSEDLDRAEASPGEWIVCPQEPVIDQRDRLRKACINLRTYVKSYSRLYPGITISKDIEEADSVIADVEKTREETTT